MKNVILVLVLTIVVGGYFINLKFVELGNPPDFYVLKNEAVLSNSEKIKVICNYHVIVFGWVDEPALEKEFQACINRHEANGYKISESSST